MVDLILQVTGRALKDSVRIITKFSDMEKTYSALSSLRFVNSTSLISLVTCMFGCWFYDTVTHATIPIRVFFMVYLRERHLMRKDLCNKLAEVPTHIICLLIWFLFQLWCHRWCGTWSQMENWEWVQNLKIVVEIDNDIEAERASEREIRRRHKSLGSLRVVTDRGLQVIHV